MNSSNRTYGHILWDEFARQFNTQDKIRELNNMFPYSSAPRDWFDRYEIVNGDPTWVRYIRFEELQEWTPEQIAYARDKGIVYDGRAEEHLQWLYEYGVPHENNP